MRQRNVTGGPVMLPTLSPPVEVFDGEEIEHDVLIAGFVAVDGPAAPAPVEVAPVVEEVVPEVVAPPVLGGGGTLGVIVD